MVKISIPAIQCKRCAQRVNVHGLRTPQNRSNMQQQGLTKLARIENVFLRSLRFSKALADCLTLHKQLSLAVILIQDNETALK